MIHIENMNMKVKFFEEILKRNVPNYEKEKLEY
jgi:hypothetical protein